MLDYIFDEVDAIAKKRDSTVWKVYRKCGYSRSYWRSWTVSIEKGKRNACHVIVLLLQIDRTLWIRLCVDPADSTVKSFFEPPFILEHKILRNLLKDFWFECSGYGRNGRNCVGYVSADLASLAQEVSIHKALCTEDFIAAMRQVGPSLHRQYQIALDNRVTWNDIAGIDPIKSNCVDTFEWPSNPETYERMGLVAPRVSCCAARPDAARRQLQRRLLMNGFTFYSLNGGGAFPAS